MLVRDLLEGEPGRVDGVEAERRAPRARVGRHRQPRAVRRLHREQEAQFPPRLVEQGVRAVPVLRDRQPPVREQRAAVAGAARPRIGVEQGPGADAAVDDIFALVARVVPAAGHVQRQRATGPSIALLVAAGEAGGAVGPVAGGAREVGALHEPRLDRHAAALLIEEAQGRARERRPLPRPDRKGPAGRAVRKQAILARRAEAAEVDAVKVRAGCRVVPGHDRGAGCDHPPRAVRQPPADRGPRRILQDGDLRPNRFEAELVEPDRGRWRRWRGREQEQGGQERDCGVFGHSVSVQGSAAQPTDRGGAVRADDGYDRRVTMATPCAGT